MKLKYILLFMLMVVSLPHSAAQDRAERGQSTRAKSSWKNSIDITYGVAAGVTIPTLRISGNEAEATSKPGFKAGIMWGVDPGAVDVALELWFSTFKIDFERDSAGLTGAELKSNTLDFPIMVGFDLTRRLKFQLGPTFSLMSNNSLTLKNGDGIEFGSIKGSVGYAAGLSYNIIRNFVVDLRYWGRFKASSNELYSHSEPYEIGLASIDITAGFRF